MTRGRVGDKTYTGHNGVATDHLRALDKLAKTPEGRYGRVAPPDRESVLRCIAAGTCPWCGRGPYKVLAIHTLRAHAVNGQELRDMAGLVKYAPICDPELSARRAAIRAGQRLPDSAYERNKGKGRTFSEAGLAAQRAKLDAARSPEQQQAASQAFARAEAERNADKYEEIKRRAATGALLKDIATAVDMHPRSVREVLRRAGMWAGDGRRRRWHVSPEESTPTG